MKFLFDLFPLLLFFAAYKGAGSHADEAMAFVNGHLSAIISGGTVTAAQAPIIIATLVGILATALQISLMALRGKKIDFVLWLSLFMFAFFGGLTIWFHDEDFIKWKLTVVYWCFAAGLLVSSLFFKKNLMRASMEQVVSLPEEIWRRVNLAWIGFFTAMGFLNLFVAFVLFKGDTGAWVSFKAFGATGIMFLFIVAQTLYLSKHMKDEA